MGPRSVSQHPGATLSKGQPMPRDERRRSQRVMIRISVTIHLMSPGSKASTLRAVTGNVSDHGAMIISSQSFSVGAHFMLENDRTRERILCRVTRTSQSAPDGYQIPVEFEKPAPKFWQIAFPPHDWKPLEG